jgi:hypothetical protein
MPLGKMSLFKIIFIHIEFSTRKGQADDCRTENAFIDYSQIQNFSLRIPMKIKLFENAALSKKVKAVELMLAGGGVIITTLLVSKFAAIVFGAFGLYRWFLRKKRTEGLIFIGLGVLTYALINQSGIGQLLINIIISGGGIMVIWGFILFLLNKKNPESE